MRKSEKGQKTEDRGQKTEDGGQKADDGGQRTEGRCQSIEFGIGNAEVGIIGFPKKEIGFQVSAQPLAAEAASPSEEKIPSNSPLEKGRITNSPLHLTLCYCIYCIMSPSSTPGIPAPISCILCHAPYPLRYAPCPLRHAHGLIYPLTYKGLSCYSILS